MRTIIIPLFGYLNRKIGRLWNVTKFAKRRKLNISNRDEVGSHIIALDTQKRKLLFAKKKPDASSCLVVDLTNLKTCTLKKEYTSINSGELKTKKLHQFLKSIVLRLVFGNGSEMVSLPLFDAQTEMADNIEQLEVQAKKWEGLVLKMIPAQTREIA